MIKRNQILVMNKFYFAEEGKRVRINIIDDESVYPFI